MADQLSDSGGEARQSFFAKQRLLDAAKLTFQQLSGLLKNVNIYPESHPFLLSLIDKLMLTINALLTDRQEVAFYFISGELFFEKHSMPIDSTIATLVEQFTSRDVGGIIFKSGITNEEFIKLAVLINKEPSALAEDGGILSVFSRENFSHITLHSVLLVDKKNKDASSGQEEDKKKAMKLFLEAIAALKEIIPNVHQDQTVNTRRVNKVVQDMVDSILENRENLIALTNLKMHDEYTYAHCVNTSILAISLGALMSLEKPLIAALGTSAMLHDIGKLRMPQDIINKIEEITDEEREEFSRHPIEGALIISDIPGLKKIAMVTALEHHQHGGTHGYPQIEGHHAQHLFSQIVSLVDAYDVLTALRVYYKIPMPPDQVVSTLLKKSGVDFNSILVKAFINMIGIFPIGTLLKLSSGEAGLVLHQTNDLMRPRVLPLKEFDGSEKDGEEINLLEKNEGRFKWDITGTIDPSTAYIDIKQYWE